MSMYEQFKTDESLETKGVIIDYGNFRVTIARAGGANKKYARVLEAKTKPYRRAIQTETMDNEKAMEVMRETYTESIILNWETKLNGEWKKGIENPNGGDLLPFTGDSVNTTFKNLPDLFLDLQQQATKVSLFRHAVLEEDAGN